MNNQLAIVTTTNNTTTNGVVKRKKSMSYLKHILLGAIIATCTFTVTMAAQPRIAEEPEYPGMVYLTNDASYEDLENLAVHMDKDIMAEIELEDNVVPLSAGEFIISYIEKDNTIVEQVENYFINGK